MHYLSVLVVLKSHPTVFSLNVMFSSSICYITEIKCIVNMFHVDVKNLLELSLFIIFSEAASETNNNNNILGTCFDI